MLKSTHIKAPLPDGWTEHKAPTGHSYYYNKTTKQSTYIRPVVSEAPIPPTNPLESFNQYQSIASVPNVRSDDNGSPSQAQFRGQRRVLQDRGRGDGFDKSRSSTSQPTDKPRSYNTIPGHEQWVLVLTKFGRRFVYNKEKEQSYWRIPDKLKNGILELDQQRIKGKAEALARSGEISDQSRPLTMSKVALERQDVAEVEEGNEDSEYEEVEITDDEDEAGNTMKRQKAEEHHIEEVVEFDEDDIAFQLAAMGQEYELEQDNRGEESAGWDEGADAGEMTYEDSAALFRDLLNDSGVNPYSPWEKLVEEGKLVDDLRYIALTTMKARKEVWEEWSREKIKVHREQRAKEEKEDPRIPYVAFLQKHATPKLYWPEFKRKFKKEPEMRNTSMADKDREKLYREHINRLKLPHSTLKSDLASLLKAQPLVHLNSSTPLDHLPAAILADLRFISLDASTRDIMIEGYISTLGPPPDADAYELVEEMSVEQHERERRQRALEAREKHVADEKRKQQRNIEFGKDSLHREEIELARAMNISRKGLKGHLMDLD